MNTFNCDEDFRLEVLGGVSIIELSQRIHDCEIKKINNELWTTSCPFHDERTPSLRFWHYDNNKPDTFYCFGCCKGGNVITYTMHSFGKSPEEAFKYLCNEFGYENPDDGTRSPLIYQLNKIFNNKNNSIKKSDINFDASIIVRDILKDVKTKYGKESKQYVEAVNWGDSQIKIINILFDQSANTTSLEKLFSQYRKKWFEKRAELLGL